MIALLSHTRGSCTLCLDHFNLPRKEGKGNEKWEEPLRKPTAFVTGRIIIIN